MDRVKPLKFEAPDSGGTELDEFPTSLDPHEDVIDCHGVAFQDTTSNDTLVTILRDSDGNLVFSDANTAPKTLSELTYGSGMTPAEHSALRQLIHFIDEGPAEGFLSGAYKEASPAGPFPTSIIWWTSADKTSKIVEQNIIWNGAFPQQVEWKIYNESGSLLATVTDTIVYNGAFEANRTRSISV